MKRLLFLFFFISIFSFSQEDIPVIDFTKGDYPIGEKVRINFDKDWRPTINIDSALYYRLITFKEKNIPSGIQEQLDSCDLQTYMDLLEDGIGYYYQYYSDNDEPCGVDIVYNVSYYSVPNNSNLYSITLDADGERITLEGDLEGNMLTLSGNSADMEYIVMIFTRN